jgi:hypothetical protein
MAWAPCSLWLVPDEAAAERLVTEGIPRGRVWLVDELVALFGLPHAEARALAMAKLRVDGDLRLARAAGALDSLLTDGRPDPRPSDRPSRRARKGQGR